MAIISGFQGIVKVGGTAVAEVTSFQLSIEVDTATVKAKGVAWDRKLQGSKSWSGTMTCNCDFADTAQQAAYTGLAAGSDVAVVLQASAVVGDKIYSGNARIKKCDINSAEGADAATRTFEFEGNGALTEAAIS